MPFLSIHPENPDTRKIKEVVQALESGAVIIYPTDTVYALGCAIDQQAAIAQICRLRGVDLKKAQFSILCRDISQASAYVSQMANETFRLIKSNTPGPFTFILKAGSVLPKTMKNNRKSIGIRIPNHPIALDLIDGIGKPILSASFHSDDTIREYYSDPYEIRELYENQVDYIIDGG
ncbi:MAG: threonylcarbamoyl-AMP synthase, partial [Saprospiraceae bacterium]|nr:threonylcarbamoyl-AMP synthase [Saprospiraceae bacterium]